MVYLNYYFTELVMDGNVITGKFKDGDSEIECRFRWVIDELDCEVWDNNQPVEEIKPLPLGWLSLKLEENGRLRESERKICY